MDSEQHTRRRSSTPGEASTTRSRRGPGPRTPIQTEQRNRELLDTALDLFLEKGFERTTIDEITAAVGMAKRTVYLRYANKTALFKASLQRAIEEWIVPVERLRAAETADVEQTLLSIGQILVANVTSPAGLRLMRITNAESGRMPEIGAFTFRHGTEPTLAYLAELVRRRIRPGGSDVPDPDEAALAFLELVVGGPASLTAWGIALEEQAIDKHTRYCVHLFLHGLLHLHDDTGGKHGAPTGAAPAPQTDAPAPDARSVQALEEENRRLKLLLADAVLEVAALRERLQPP